MINESTFEQKIETTKFQNIEELLHHLDSPFTKSGDVIKIIKKFLTDPMHEGNSTINANFYKNSILSYFETNDNPIPFKFNFSAIYDGESSNLEDEYNTLSLDEFMKIFVNSNPSITEKSVFFTKFHRGLDASTLVDRFNFEGWDQLTKHFGSENHRSWNTDLCPVPIKLTRIKTSFTHVGLLDVDAIRSMQDYLDYREEKTGSPMISGHPIYITKYKKPITLNWIFTHFSKLVKHAGIKTTTNGIPHYKTESHELRDLLKSTLIDSGCRPDVADHVIGHMPKDSYEKQAKLYPESIRKEYAKASKRLNIFTKFTSVVNGTDDSDELKLQLKEKIFEANNVLEKRLDDEAERIRQEKFVIEQQRQMRQLQDTVNELKKEIRGGARKEEKPLEFCCIDCSTVRDKESCPVCNSKLKRTYEDKVQN